MTEIQSCQKIVPIEVDIQKIRTVFNQVVVSFDPKENERTASGIYTPATGEVDSIAEHANRKGVVVKVPEYLYYSRDDASGMRWKTDIEIKVGDEVWLNHTTVNDFQYRSDNKNYRSVSYEDIVVARRGAEVIMLNGYMLLDPVYTTTRVLSHQKKERDVRLGTIAFIGKANKEYSSPEYVQLGKTVYRTDPQGLKVGDTVYFDKKSVKKVRFMEYGAYNKFDGKAYLIAQRYMVAGVVEDE